MSAIKLTVNGRAHTVDVDPATPLLYVLSDDLALRGPKFGCGLGQCGACTVIARGRAIRSCVTPVSTVTDAEITTLEGLGTVERPHPIQQAFIEQVLGTMQQAGILHFGFGRDALLMKAGKGRRRGNAVKTMSVIKNAKFHEVPVNRLQIRK